MNIKDVLEKLDSLQYTEIEKYLMDMMALAREEADFGSVITLLNEIIGFCRDTCQYNKTRIYSNELLTLLEEQKLEGTTEYATSLLNIANANRAAGDLEESMDNYQKAYEIYNRHLAPTDFLFASINNNMALLYQEKKEYDKASECLKRALKVVEVYPDRIIERAVTLSNLAQSLLREEKMDEAASAIEEAMAIFADGRQEDFHYSGALSVYAELCFMRQQYAEAVKYYNQAMHELEKHTGKNENLNILSMNRDAALAKAKEMGQKIEQVSEVEKGMDICKRFYTEYGKPMIHDKFAAYEDKIAVGLAGEGSDCFGFDDELSRDHDWGPGFCMWVDDETYEAIGEQLQAEYDKLPEKYMDYTRRVTVNAAGRTGVIRIRDFYERLLQIADCIPQNESQWLGVSEEGLATATNGEVFRDDEGSFSSIRNRLLDYYPDSVYRKKLAFELVKMAQTGQYNFERCKKRGDKVTAKMYLAEYMEHTLHTVYLLNHKYAPYKKWLQTGAAKLEVLPVITDILCAIADMDIFDAKVTGSVEIVAKLIIAELQNQKLLTELNTTDEYYLEYYGNKIFESIDNISMDEKSNQVKAKSMEELIDKIVKLEWEAFDKVINEGGRAGCQDDWTTFSIMRKSQYMTWTEEMLLSYISDFEAANQAGWNLITEKYGRMEASTAPEKYAKIEDKLPARDDRTRSIVEEIVKIQVGFMEEFAAKYPRVAGTARSIHTSEDTPYNTSYETYLRGELLTYSEETLALYGQYVVGYVKAGKNIAYDTMTNSAILYGFKSLEELEDKLD